jgi:hypothetical protein
LLLSGEKRNKNDLKRKEKNSFADIAKEYKMHHKQRASKAGFY